MIRFCQVLLGQQPRTEPAMAADGSPKAWEKFGGLEQFTVRGVGRLDGSQFCFHLSPFAILSFVTLAALGWGL